jgi:hypothetical protein
MVLGTDLGWSESLVHIFGPQDILSNQAVRGPAAELIIGRRYI